MKVCFKCRVAKPLAEFYPHGAMADGHLNKCKECTKADVALYRAEKIEAVRGYDRARASRPERRAHIARVSTRWAARFPERRRAHVAVRRAVQRGLLVRPGRCNRCPSTGRLHGHHRDYSLPLEVEWLCVPCHKVADRERVA